MIIDLNVCQLLGARLHRGQARGVRQGNFAASDEVARDPQLLSGIARVVLSDSCLSADACSPSNI